MTPPTLSLYLHIPFCKFKCFYCDFNTYAGIEALLPGYVEALAAEVRRWGAAVQSPDGRKVEVATVFLGGGTPSMLSAQQLERILGAIHDAFALQPGAEVTLEANPESVSLEKARAYRALGVNRMSMGAQSMDDAELKMLGRLHDSARLRVAYDELRRAGLDNLNLDFIYGLPGQRQETWSHTLTEALALAPEHLSLYALTVEERTPFHKMVQEGALPEPDPDAAADMYEEAEQRLAIAGYRQYEISNWSRPGREARHNLVYWRNGPFIGCGPGAHSYLRGARFAVMNQPREYVQRIQALESLGPPPALSLAGSRLENIASLQAIAPVATLDPYTDRMERAETLVLGLRLNEGVHEEDYKARFGQTPTELFGPALEESAELGLLERANGGSVLRLTTRGRLLANEVFVRVMGQ
jgi:oxygen-independent coproporphyrinogen-3 oxidase